MNSMHFQLRVIALLPLPPPDNDPIMTFTILAAGQVQCLESTSQARVLWLGLLQARLSLAWEKLELSAGKTAEVGQT